MFGLKDLHLIFVCGKPHTRMHKSTHLCDQVIQN